MIQVLPALVFIALGSNLDSVYGSPRQTVRKALERLAGFSERPLLCSSLWRSRPEDCPPHSPDFVNAVAGLLPRDGETPESLLASLMAVEHEFGRRRGPVVNAPRTLDLDLIDFAGERRADRALTLPHPAAHLRAFVLLPLAEIAPDLKLPGQSLTVARLSAALQRSDQEVTKIDE